MNDTKYKVQRWNIQTVCHCISMETNSLSHQENTWFLKVYKIIFRRSLKRTCCSLSVMVAYFLFYWEKKQYKHGSCNLILQFIIHFHFEIYASVPFHVKASALNLASGCQGALASAGQVFSFLVASFFGPPLLSCSGRSWPQQMLNTAGASLRPRYRGEQGHCPKPVEKEGKDAMKWHYITLQFNETSYEDLQ